MVFKTGLKSISYCYRWHNLKYQDIEVTKLPQKIRKRDLSLKTCIAGAPSLTPTGAPVNFAGNQ